MKTKIKTFEDAFKAINVDPTADLAILEQLPEPARTRAIANYKLDIIQPALNNEGQKEPWIADYTDYSQWKYFPRIYLSSGGVWLYFGCVSWCTTANAGARPFRTSEIGKYAATQFIDLFVAIK